MSKKYIEGTVRFDRQPKAGAPARSMAGFSNFKLCAECNRYIPTRHYPEHVGAEHPDTLLHIERCPKCEAKPYTVRASEIAGECENVSTCDYCGFIQTPKEYQQ